MDIALSADDVAFREEVQNFFDTQFTPEVEANLRAKGATGMVDWQKILYEKGWVAPNWPVEHGGTGWSATQKYISRPSVLSVVSPTLCRSDS